MQNNSEINESNFLPFQLTAQTCIFKHLSSFDRKGQLTHIEFLNESQNFNTVVFGSSGGGMSFNQTHLLEKLTNNQPVRVIDIGQSYKSISKIFEDNTYSSPLKIEHLNKIAKLRWKISILGFIFRIFPLSYIEKEKILYLSPAFKNLLNLICESGLADYPENYNRDIIQSMYVDREKIANATLNEIRLLFRYWVSGERFCSGWYVASIQTGEISCLIKRLNVLLKTLKE